MGKLEHLNVGLVGAAGRGGSFRAALEATGARIHAICDTNKDALDRCAEGFGTAERYTDYAQMLESSELDAVVIGTPMQFHAPQAIMALNRNLHVLSEVPAAVSVEECEDLVRACRRSEGAYMMAENVNYTRPNMLVRELCRRGLFGTLYYAESEYLHELKKQNEVTKWRRKWQTGIEGITYGTHNLGPILQWMAGDRAVRVCCEGSGYHYTDLRGDHYHQDSNVMLCKMQSGGLVKVRVDMLSDRPQAMLSYLLQGTDGCYESSRSGPNETDKLWLCSLSVVPRWFGLDAVEGYVPDVWRNLPEAAQRSGHDGAEYVEVLDFVSAVSSGTSPPLGVHEAMDMTLPGLLSQQSILEGGRWLAVPDSREWPEEPSKPQLQMVWPERLLARPPARRLPNGYGLRQYEATDEHDYVELMAKAGFKNWNHDRVEQQRQRVIPGGFFLVEHGQSRQLVAAAMAQHTPDELHPQGGVLGWVAGDPEHKGKGLGLAVCAAAVARLISAGYKRIYLRTDDFRLPAIKTYLKLGFEPFLFCDGMAERWQAICASLHLPFKPRPGT
jgi:predicted dehydrogenase/GNAT superfamily N-acetyltransferase